MADILFNSAGVSASASKIRGYLENIENDIKGISNSKDEVKNSWKGIGSDNYISSLDNSATEVKALVTKLYELTDLLDKSAAAMQKQQEEIANASSNL